MYQAMDTTPAAQRTRWNEVAAALERPGTAQRLILTEAPRAWERSLAYYIPAMGWLGGRQTAHVSEIDVVRRLPQASACPHLAWWGPACHILPRWRGNHRLGARGFHLAGTQLVAGFEIERWLAPRPVAIRAPIPGGGRLIVTPSKVQML
jgi:hypothetical protein